MKIAQIVCAFPPYKGGMGNSVYEFSRHLAALGQEVTVFTPNYKGWPAQEEMAGFKVERLAPLLKYGNAAFMPSLLPKLADFDIWHLHYPFFGGAELLWLASWRKPKNVKLVIHFHMDTPGLSFLARFLSWPNLLTRKSLFNRADAVVCASLDYAQSSSLWPILERNSSKLLEIPFGVDLVRFKPAEKKDDSILKLLFVGGLDQAHYFKGVEVLLRALAGLEDLAWSLKIVGSGNLQASYENLSRQLKLEEKVEFLGNVSFEALPEIFSQQDALILPSTNTNEAFGLVLLEAMASGLAVVASDLPGVRRVFEVEKNGLLAKVGDKQDLLEKIRFLGQDKNRLRGYGLSGRAWAEEKYAWPKLALELNDLYKKIWRKEN